MRGKSFSRVGLPLVLSLAAILPCASPAPLAGEGLWTYLGPEINSYPQSILVDPNDPSVIYLSNGPSGSHRTADGGASWNRMDIDRAVSKILMNPADRSVLFAATSHGVYRTTDAGASWAMIAGDTFEEIAADPHHPGVLYGTLTLGGVKRSADGGATWAPVGEATGGDRLLFDPGTPGTIYVVQGAFQISKSTDGGGSWTDVGTGIPVDNSVNALALAPATPSVLYAGTEDGLYKSTDGGENWVARNLGLAVEGSALLNISDVVTDPTCDGTVYAATFYGVFKSVDGAAHWSRMTRQGFPDPAGHTVVTALALNPSDPEILLAGMRPSGVCSIRQRTQGAEPPLVESIQKKADPFRLKIRGTGFQEGATVTIGASSSPWAKVSIAGSTTLTVKGGDKLKDLFPAGQAVVITIRNPDGGEAVTSFTR